MSPTSEDDLGLTVEVPTAVSRVVSLVPSLTEAIAVTAADLLVGATKYCTHPPEIAVTRVGGTKNPDVSAVRDLRPDVVVANEEENRLADLDDLRATGLAVWVTAPRTLTDSFGSLDRMLRRACRLDRPPWLDAAEDAWRTPYDGPRRRAAVPIWRRPWMVLGRDTFAGDVLRRLGIDNVYDDAAERYPRVTVEEIRSRGVDVVVLPDEPYAFSAEDGPEAFPEVATALVSGRHLTWYGPSLVEARAVLAEQLAHS